MKEFDLPASQILHFISNKDDSLLPYLIKHYHQDKLFFDSLLEFIYKTKQYGLLIQPVCLLDLIQPIPLKVHIELFKSKDVQLTDHYKYLQQDVKAVTTLLEDNSE